MHAGTEAEYTDQLIRPTSATGNDIIPTILLESTDKAKLQQTQSLLGEMSPIIDMGSATSQYMSMDGYMRNLEPNSTVTIDVVAFKNYRHESSERIYSLQFEVYKDLFGGSKDLQNPKIDIKQYLPIIDNAAITLKVE